jgi:[acyl-carrier-protein] S-malonyltransferase
MKLSYIFGGGTMKPAGGDFYEQYEVVRKWCDRTQEWTGLKMPELLVQDSSASLMPNGPTGPREPADLSVKPDFMYRGAVRQAAYSIGIVDTLAEQGIYPDSLTGHGLGGMIASCVAGCITREDLFRVLRHMSTFPLAPVGESARGVAFAMLPVDADIEWYCGENRPNIYLVGDTDMGMLRALMLSGYLKDLEKLAAEAPTGQVEVIGAMGGLHSPLEQYQRDLLEPFLCGIEFRDPELPLFSTLGERKRLEAGEDVRREMLDNIVSPTSKPLDIAGSLNRYGTKLALVLGAAIQFPPESQFPVLRVAVVKDIEQVMAMLHEPDIGIRQN